MTSHTPMFGPLIGDNSTKFRLWAPSGKGPALIIDGRPAMPMAPREDGWWEIETHAPPETRYRFQVSGLEVPDPASRRQDGGVHGHSVVCRSGYTWETTSWRGRPWEETVFYEMHAGLYGGFAAAAKKLPELAALGITAVQLMPIAEFPGARNWGYDGVLPFAPAAAYGAPDDLRAFIDQAHRNGLMVFLDVVYNHFGPDGNYLGAYAADFFLPDVHTPWGSAINFRNPYVRRFVFENALYWLTEFRMDGLRFDAVHAIPAADWLDTLAKELRGRRRNVHLVLENEKNDASHLRRGFDAQWNDDFHHALHVLLTRETNGYYADFARRPAEQLARALSEGFVYQGEYSTFGRRRGTSSRDLPATAFVTFLQNHDQTGNRALGERLTALTEADALKAAVALVLLSPQIPLLFMGEEIGSRAPFLYFTDHNRDLAEAVRQGRRREFAAFVEEGREIPDPNAPETFLASRPESDAPRADEWRTLYGRLLELRKRRITPYLAGVISLGAQAVGPAAVMARWRLSNNATLAIACNLGDEAAPMRMPFGLPIWGPSDTRGLPPRCTIAWMSSS